MERLADPAEARILSRRARPRAVGVAGTACRSVRVFPSPAVAGRAFEEYGRIRTAKRRTGCQTGCECQDAHPGKAGGLDAVMPVFDDQAVSGWDAHLGCGEQEEIGGGLTVGYLAGAEDSSAEVLVQAGGSRLELLVQAGGSGLELELLRAAAGCEAAGHGDLIERLRDPCEGARAASNASWWRRSNSARRSSGSASPSRGSISARTASWERPMNR